MQGLANAVMEEFYPDLEKPLVAISPRMTWAAGRTWPTRLEIRVAKGYIEELGREAGEETLKHEIIHAALWQHGIRQIHGRRDSIFYAECRRLGIPDSRFCKPWGEQRLQTFYVFQCSRGHERVLYQNRESPCCLVCTRGMLLTHQGKIDGTMSAWDVAQALKEVAHAPDRNPRQ